MNNDPTTADAACEYVKAAPPGGDEGNVHLVTTVHLRQGRAERSPGEFLCGRAYGRRVRQRRPATRAEFKLEPCPRCLAAAEKFLVDVGSLWSDLPGPRVRIYTTSPADRDRPYALGGRVAGEYAGEAVRQLVVPADFEEVCRRWCQRDRYHAWDEATWLGLVGAGRAAGR